MPVSTSFYTIDWYDTVDMTTFRENSRQLDEFLEGDFHTMDDEIAAAFPNDEGMPKRYVALAARVAHEVATLYRRPARRVWGGVNRAQRDKLDEIWQASGFDEELHRLHRRLVLQNTMVCAVLPDSPRRYCLQHWAPHEAAVDAATGKDAMDIMRANRVRLLWPIGNVDEQIYYGWAVLTPTDAYIEADGNAAPLFGGLGNQFGRVPLFTARLGNPPRRGRFFAPIAEDVLATNIALNLADGDMEKMLHHQAWGQKVIEPGDEVPPQAMVDALPTGADRMMVLPGRGARYKIAQGDPKVKPYVDLVEYRMKTIATMRDISPSRFAKANTAQTGSARRADAEDREQAREAQKAVFLKVEREMLRLVGEMSRLYGDPVPIPESATLESIDWADFEPSADPLADAQAHQLTDAWGETSPVDRVANKHSLPRDAAVARVTDRLIEAQKIRADVALATGAASDEGALSGAIVDAAVNVVSAVTEGRIGVEAATRILVGALNIDEASASRMLSDVEPNSRADLGAKGADQDPPGSVEDDRGQEPGTGGSDDGNPVADDRDAA